MSGDSASARPCFEIVLRPERNCADPIQSLRAVLKLALRRCQLRAVSIAVAPPDETEGAS